MCSSIKSSNLSYEQIKKIKEEKVRERKRNYHKNYYHNKVKKEFVYCSSCDKYIQKASVPKHLLSKKHIDKFNNNNNNV
tara:strand:- start:1899 stop:2135 length:237 start_codon:yes stop_codon:yes gene_type:complete